MKKYATIDIGTNSMRLLLAEIEEENILHRQKKVNTTRIGKAVDQSGKISDEGIQRNVEAFSQFVEEAKAYGAQHIYAMATSAVRDAANGREFVQEVLNKTGVAIEVISGEEEAALGYQGVVLGLQETDKSQIVIDIGGGSTEFILGRRRELLYTISENIGAVRMTERWLTTAPVDMEEYRQMEKDIKDTIKGTVDQLKRGDIDRLIGIGGTATTIASLHQQLETYDIEKVHNYSLSLEEILDLKEKLLPLTTTEIKSLKGIHPKRADIIVAGITILTVAMEELNIPKLVVSEYDNLEGLLYNRSCEYR